ncbi:MAG: hypothetical protein PF447_14875, partial [Spirochaetaceae bacterium]|nr:hypothetical protein [Spirochaetaceae bacterium]
MGLTVEQWPYFRRASDYHLYDDKGKRYLDLFQNNGRAIMGHRPGKFSQYIKNSLSRGVWADYPSPIKKRLAGVLKKIFPEYSSMTLFTNKERAQLYLLKQQQTVLKLENIFLDPLYHNQGESWLWRPHHPNH